MGNYSSGTMKVLSLYWALWLEGAMSVIKWVTVALLLVVGLAGIASAKEKSGGKVKWQLYGDKYLIKRRIL